MDPLLNKLRFVIKVGKLLLRPIVLFVTVTSMAQPRGWKLAVAKITLVV